MSKKKSGMSKRLRQQKQKRLYEERVMQDLYSMRLNGLYEVRNLYRRFAAMGNTFYKDWLVKVELEIQKRKNN